MNRLPHPRFTSFLLIFALVGTLALPVLPPERALIAGFDLAATAFIFSCIPLWSERDPAAARQRGARDDGGRVLLLIVSTAAFLSVLIATGMLLSGNSRLEAADFAICVVTLVLAWIFSNLIFTFHYSHLFYDQAGGKDLQGLVFPDTEEPDFADFCYFAFVIGMTFQVSDVVVNDRRMRQTVLAHGVLAFFFNLGVLALAVNLAAGLLSGAS
ncbi:DUF1345 domain-containing protein [Hyphomonas sp. WL0036]|uniref:DUF1345 domain-containing protein n=1 Tax=Hyphomonas sediminis TaxID=2866160 RepID=UPI001C7FBBD7|nr:DUF1345 domain-containing protein [Hyphomonas sediminis]MBY9068407.1 DUF1345 domain-containing protein [Hyphomonas sediminis]